MDLFAELLALAAALDAQQVDYAICGAVALAVHGAPRATKDINIMAREADRPRLREAAKVCGFRIEALPTTFQATGISIRRFTKLAPAGQALMLDVLLADTPLTAVWDARVRLDVQLPDGDSRVLSVVSREGLITRKLRGRPPQDLVDVRRLEELGRGEGD